MKKTKLFFTSLVPVAFFATGISFLTTSCGETDPTNYVGNYDGTDWKGRTEGSINITIVDSHVVSVTTATNSYKAENLIIPKQIKFEDGSIENLDSIGVLFNATLTGSLTLSTPTIPDGEVHTSISTITSLNLLEGVELIGNRAFKGCEQIVNALSIPDSVTTIGEYAFNDCKNIVGDLIIPNNSIIKQYAFANCAKIEKLFIPSEAVLSGWNSFQDCSSINNIVFDSFDVLPENWGSWIFQNLATNGTVFSTNSEVTSADFLAFAISKALPNTWIAG